jgi:hypothetical protein
LPILSNSGELAILSVSSSLLEVLAAVNRSTFDKLAILGDDESIAAAVSLEGVRLKDLRVKPPINLTNKEVMQKLLKDLPNSLLLSKILDSGYRFDRGITYFY